LDANIQIVHFNDHLMNISWHKKNTSPPIFSLLPSAILLKKPYFGILSLRSATFSNHFVPYGMILAFDMAAIYF